MTKVLVFESDSTFANELSAALATYGCQTSVVDDASAGLSAAVSAKPDLILLSIELPRMNGFSVCNKLKRDPALKDVPLIIMSSDSSEETFEQHRRLRTRAEDYVHKPIGFDQLLQRIRAFVPLEAGAAAAADVPEEDVVVIDSESFRPGSDEGGESLETEVESFANSAFDAIIERPGPRSSPPPSNGAAAPLSVAPPAPAPPSLAPAPLVPIAGSVPPPDLAAPLRQQLAALEEELAAARRRIGELEAAASSPSDGQELERLRRELEETRAKAGKGGSSAREFLDLREALNKKDKELLDLRDQLTHRDKELLGLRDSALALEREKADLSDKHDEFERMLVEAKKLEEAARADKEQASKRAEDFKRKLEKLTTDHDARVGELTALRQQYETETAAKTGRIEELERMLEESRRAAAEELERAVGEARQRAEQAAAEQLSARETELKQEHATKMTELIQARDDALAQLESQHSTRIVELNQTHEQSRQELIAAHEKAREELSAANERSRNELVAANEQSRSELVASHERALSELRAQKEELERSQGQRISDLERELDLRTRERDEEREARGQRDAELAARRSELEAQQRELEGVRGDLNQARQNLERAKAKWTEDRGSLERAKDALAAALSQIEEAESRPIE